MIGTFRKIVQAAFPETIPEIDLHGLKVPQALEAVSNAVGKLREKGGSLKIICGKGKGSPGGKGVLKEAVEGWLQTHGEGLRVTSNLDRDGLAGSITVTARRQS